jgi:hypothetical protein
LLHEFAEGRLAGPSKIAKSSNGEGKFCERRLTLLNKALEPTWGGPFVTLPRVLAH